MKNKIIFFKKKNIKIKLNQNAKKKGQVTTEFNSTQRMKNYFEESKIVLEAVFLCPSNQTQRAGLAS